MTPYFNEYDQDEEDQQGQAQVQISGASPTTEAAGGAPSGAPQGQKKELNTGSGFQNLDKYLNTNQAQQFGQQTLGKVQGRVDDAGQKMQAADAQFRTAVADQTKAPDQAQINQAIADPTKADAKQYQAWTKQDYTGPKNLAENQDAWSKYWSGTQQAKTEAGLLGSEAGRFSLLDQYFGKPTYNHGQKSLDNLLMQQSGTGRQTKDLQNQATLLKTKGTQGAQDLANFANERDKAVDQSRLAARSAIGIGEDGRVSGGALGGMQGAIDSKVAKAIKDGNYSYDQAVKDFEKGILSPQTAEALGITGSLSTYGIDPTKYLRKSNDPINVNTMATPEERARYMALSQMAGVDPSSYMSAEAGKLYDPTKAMSFDMDAFNAAANTERDSLYNKYVTQPKTAAESNVAYNWTGDPNLMTDEEFEATYGKPIYSTTGTAPKSPLGGGRSAF